MDSKCQRCEQLEQEVTALREQLRAVYSEHSREIREIEKDIAASIAEEVATAKRETRREWEGVW